MCWIQSHTEQRLILDIAGRSLVRMDLSYRSTVPVYSTGIQYRQRSVVEPCSTTVVLRPVPVLEYSGSTIQQYSYNSTQTTSTYRSTAQSQDGARAQHTSRQLDAWHKRIAGLPVSTSHASAFVNSLSTFYFKNQKKKSQLSEAPRQKNFPPSHTLEEYNKNCRSI